MQGRIATQVIVMVLTVLAVIFMAALIAVGVAATIGGLLPWSLAGILSGLSYACRDFNRSLRR